MSLLSILQSLIQNIKVKFNYYQLKNYNKRVELTT